MTTKKTNIDGTSLQGSAEEVLGITRNVPLTGTDLTAEVPVQNPPPASTYPITPPPQRPSPLTLEDVKLEIMESTMSSAVKVRLIEWLAVTPINAKTPKEAQNKMKGK